MAESNHSKEIPPSAAADDIVDTPTPYEPKDAIAQSVRSATFTGSAGLLLAAVQNTLSRENIGAFGVFSRFGGTIALFGTYPGTNLLLFHLANERAAAMGGTYAFVSTASANLRQKNDAYNPGLGGFFAGALVGLRSTSKCTKERQYALLLILLGRPSHAICSRKWNSSWRCPCRGSVYWRSGFLTTIRPK